MNNQETHFSAFKDGLRDYFGADVYDSVFAPLRLGHWQEDQVVLLAKNNFSAHLINERYGAPMCQMWNRLCGPVDHLEVVGEGDEEQKPRIPNMLRSDVHKDLPASRSPFRTNTAVPPAANPAQKVVFRELEPPTPSEETPKCGGSGTLNRYMTLERFCVNDTNRVARHAVTRLLEGTAAPCTYVYGAYGRGKSHLVNSAGLEWLRRHPNDKIMFLTYDSLVADVSDACISNSVKELRQFLHDTDMLIFDDVQLLRGRKRTQEELACLIERLQQAGKPVLISGALSPTELAETGISQRLADRLHGGVSVEIERPDYDLRLRVAEQLAQSFCARSGYTFEQRHIEMIARRCDSSIRELEGVIRFFELAIESQGDRRQSLSDDRVRQILDEKLAGRRVGVTLEDVFEFTLDVFGVSREELAGRNRRQPLVRARQAFCLAARKLTDAPLTAIGLMINRDHTTVMHSVRKAEIIAETDAGFGDRISRIFDEFEGR